MKKLLYLLFWVSNAPFTVSASEIYNNDQVKALMDTTALDVFISAIQANPAIFTNTATNQQPVYSEANPISDLTSIVDYNFSDYTMDSTTSYTPIESSIMINSVVHHSSNDSALNQTMGIINYTSAPWSYAVTNGSTTTTTHGWSFAVAAKGVPIPGIEATATYSGSTSEAQTTSTTETYTASAQTIVVMPGCYGHVDRSYDVTNVHGKYGITGSLKNDPFLTITTSCCNSPKFGNITSKTGRVKLYDLIANAEYPQGMLTIEPNSHKVLFNGDGDLTAYGHSSDHVVIYATLGARTESGAWYDTLQPSSACGSLTAPASLYSNKQISNIKRIPGGYKYTHHFKSGTTVDNLSNVISHNTLE